MIAYLAAVVCAIAGILAIRVARARRKSADLAKWRRYMAEIENDWSNLA